MPIRLPMPISAFVRSAWIHRRMKLKKMNRNTRKISTATRATPIRIMFDWLIPVPLVAAPALSALSPAFWANRASEVVHVTGAVPFRGVLVRANPDREGGGGVHPVAHAPGSPVDSLVEAKVQVVEV